MMNQILQDLSQNFKIPSNDLRFIDCFFDLE